MDMLLFQGYVFIASKYVSTLWKLGILGNFSLLRMGTVNSLYSLFQKFCLPYYYILCLIFTVNSNST